jgi:hypothetical protein
MTALFAATPTLKATLIGITSRSAIKNAWERLSSTFATSSSEGTSMEKA